MIDENEKLAVRKTLVLRIQDGDKDGPEKGTKICAVVIKGPTGTLCAVSHAKVGQIQIEDLREKPETVNVVLGKPGNRDEEASQTVGEGDKTTINEEKGQETSDAAEDSPETSATQDQ